MCRSSEWSTKDDLRDTFFLKVHSRLYVCPRKECLWKIVCYSQEKPISPPHALHVTFKMKAQVMYRKFLVHKYHVVLSFKFNESKEQNTLKLSSWSTHAAFMTVINCPSSALLALWCFCHLLNENAILLCTVGVHYSIHILNHLTILALH